MGKIAAIMVVGFAAIVGIVKISMSKRADDTHRDNFAYYDKVQSNNISKSALELYKRKLRENPDLSGTIQVENILGGSANITIAEKFTGNRNRLALTVAGSYGSQQSNSSVDAEADSLLPMPRITGALGVSFLSRAKLKLGKDTEIDGNNHDLNGDPDTSISGVAGISLGHPDQLADLDYKPKDVKIKGKGVVDPNVEVQIPQPDYYDWAMQLARRADAIYTNQEVAHVDTLGTLAHPKVTYIKGNTKFNEDISGAGILIVEGNLTIKKRFDFVGIVLAVGDEMDNEKVKIGKKSDTHILGALMVAGRKCKVKTGSFEVKYSNAAIGKAIGLVQSHNRSRYRFTNAREDRGVGNIMKRAAQLGNGNGNGNGKGGNSGGGG
jgi:hypothetical protein